MIAMLNVLSLECFANHLLFIRSQKCICDEFINDQINTLKAANRDNDVTRTESKIYNRFGTTTRTIRARGQIGMRALYQNKILRAN